MFFPIYYCNVELQTKITESGSGCKSYETVPLKYLKDVPLKVDVERDPAGAGVGEPGLLRGILLPLHQGQAGS